MPNSRRRCSMYIPEIPAPMTIASYSATRSRLSGSDVVSAPVVSAPGINASGMLSFPDYSALLCTTPPACSPAKTERRSFPQHRGDLVEGADARIHLHRLVEAVGMRGGVAAPAA